MNDAFALAVDGPLSAARRWFLHPRDVISGALGFFCRALSAEDLVRVAQHRTRLTDFGDWDIEEPLARLVKAYEEEADLSAFGRIAARWDLLRLLSNLLRFRDEEKRDPTILSEKIEKPIFITGMPRSGTSFLHDLLSMDPSNLVVRCWETIYPFPLDGAGTNDAERRRLQVDRQLAAFARIAPEMPIVHPLNADSLQECTELAAHVFRSMRFDTTHVVPSYRRWLDRESQITAYRFHKRFLQHLQRSRKGTRWVLKCPDHVFALDALLEVYPDARFIFTHRDPLAVLLSLSRLTETLRRPFTSLVDRLQLGAELSERWGTGASLLVRAARALPAASVPLLNFEFGQIVLDPVACVGSIYRRFGLELDSESEMQMSRFAATKSRHENAHNRVRLEDYGFDARTECRKFHTYTDFFKIAAERRGTPIQGTDQRCGVCREAASLTDLSN